MSASNNRWYILGAGSIGCLWASYWRSQGTPVTLLQSRAASTEDLCLSVNDEQQSFTVDTLEIDQLTDSGLQIERLFISTKAQHTASALSRLSPWLSSSATILAVQNGLAVLNLQTILSGQSLFAGVTTDGAYRSAKTHVHHAGVGKTLVGSLTNANTHALLAELPSALKIESCDDIERRLWHKFAVNCAINPLTVKYQCRNGQLLDLPEARQELSGLIKEIQHVVTQLHPPEWFQQLEADVHEVLRLTANNINSMLQDSRNRRETELPQLNAYLQTLAEQNQLTCPINLALLERLQTPPAQP